MYTVPWVTKVSFDILEYSRKLMKAYLRIGKIFKGLRSPCGYEVIFIYSLVRHGIKTHVKLVLRTNIFKV